MSDLTALSDAELQALYQPQEPLPVSTSGRPRVYIGGPKSDLASLSDEELKAAYDGQSSALGDVAKSAGIGLVKGAVGLAGMAGDLSEYGARGIDYASRKISPLVGLEPPAARQEQDPFLGSGQIQSAIEGVTGPFYKPQTTAGEYAQTGGEFATNLIGPGKFLPKLLAGVIAPAATSETAGQLSKGTALEPFARIGGAIMGGMGGARMLAPKPNTLTGNQLGEAATAAYEHPVVKNLELHPSSAAYAADQIASALQGKGFRKITSPQTFDILGELKNPLGPTVKVADIQGVRTALGKVAENFANPTEQNAANKAIKGIDNYLSGLKPFDVAKGDGKQAASILNDAKGNYAAKMRVNRTDKAEYRAELNAASAHSGGNINNATRQALKSMLLNDKSMRGFNAEERAMMEKVVKGTPAGNVARKVGKLLSTQGMHGANVIGGSLAAAPFTHGLSLIAPVAGYAAKKIGDASTAKAIRKLDEMIAMRSPLGQSLPPVKAGLDPLVTGLLSGLTELRNQRTR